MLGCGGELGGGGEAEAVDGRCWRECRMMLPEWALTAVKA